MLAYGTPASFAVHRAHAVTELRYLSSRPAEFAQSGDNPRDDRGLPNIARVSTYHDEFHRTINYINTGPICLIAPICPILLPAATLQVESIRRLTNHIRNIFVR